MLNSNMSELRIELENAIKNLGIYDYRVDKPEQIVSEIKEIYVNGNPRTWWLSLKHRQYVFSYTDNSGYKNISQIVSKQLNESNVINKHIFLIADEDNEQIYVYNVPLNSLPEIIENCRYFEYYVADHELSWLICENDHGDLIVCSTIK
ncbi:hypothetical protein ACDT65_000481 [Salmonella enterica subsp. enterica]|nr:hypothetical protein [Salmonella enterica subsp. enterica]